MPSPADLAGTKRPTVQPVILPPRPVGGTTIGERIDAILGAIHERALIEHLGHAHS